MNREVECPHCNRYFVRWHFKVHERSCKENPSNTEECPVCGVEFYARSGRKTCSTSCGAVARVDRGIKPPENPESAKYQNVCFSAHVKECVICGEKRVLEVHHFNGDHSDNSPENLVPLCPTHHRYMHSKFRYMIEMAVDLYVMQRWGKEIPIKGEHKDINFELYT